MTKHVFPSPGISTILTILITSALLGLVAPPARADSPGEIIFQPLYAKCAELKKELSDPNLSVTYNVRPKNTSPVEAWTLRWQNVHIPIPKVRYSRLIILEYPTKERKLTQAAGFILVSDTGVAVMALHYFKSIRFIYTNGLDFITHLPQQELTGTISNDLKYPEFSTTAAQRIFSYTPKDLNCDTQGKSRKTYLLAQLMVKAAYTRGIIQTVYKHIAGYTGWVSLERTPLATGSGARDARIWKAFYTKSLNYSVVNNIRIYLPTQTSEAQVQALGLALGVRQVDLAERPAWLLHLEHALHHRETQDWQQLETTLRHARFSAFYVNPELTFGIR